jgi:hypothetical protein
MRGVEEGGCVLVVGKERGKEGERELERVYIYIYIYITPPVWQRTSD